MSRRIDVTEDLVRGFTAAYRARYGPMTAADARRVLERFHSWHTLAEATALNDARAGLPWSKGAVA